MTSEDDDPFSYTPLVNKRQKFATQPSSNKKTSINRKSVDKNTKNVPQSQQIGASKSPNKRKSQALKRPLKLSQDASHSPTKVLFVPEGNDDTVCFICQMPFNLLLHWESRELHSSNCLELQIDKMPPCDMGIYCDNTIRNHYAQFNHKELAKHRSENPLKVNDKAHRPKPNVVLGHKETFINDNRSSNNINSGTADARMDNSRNIPGTGLANKNFKHNDTNVNGRLRNVPCGEKEKLSADNQSAVYGHSKENVLKPQNSEQPINREARPIYFNEAANATSSTEPLNSFDSAESSDRNAPLKIAAEKDVYGDYRIKVSVNPRIELNQFEMKIQNNKNCDGKSCAECDLPNCEHATQRIKVKSVITPKKAKPVTLNSYFKVSDSQSSVKGTAFEKIMRAQQTKLVIAKQPKNTQPKTATESSSNLPRKCPFYKKIPGTSFVVDAFCYGIVPGITKYFLSHFHYDHYRGLRKKFSLPIICSKVTANLIRLRVGVDSKYIREINLNEPTVIEGTEVTLLEANHCPGAVMFLFKIPVIEQTMLHCGDFRACPAMEEYPSLWNNRIDKLYLDTTYCQPEYDFPSQEDAILSAIELIHQHIAAYPKTLLICGTYTIGKERVFLAIAEEFNCKIWAKPDKMKILRALEDNQLLDRLTNSPNNAQIHLMEMEKVRNFKFPVEYLEDFSSQYNHILSIIPTGWTHQKGSTSESSLQNMKIKTFKDNTSRLEIPYSEHSSFSELKRFVKFLKLHSPSSVVPTVNIGNPNSRNNMLNLFKNWIAESS